jgi:hypothetical protein
VTPERRLPSGDAITGDDAFIDVDGRVTMRYTTLITFIIAAGTASGAPSAVTLSVQARASAVTGIMFLAGL